MMIHSLIKEVRKKWQHHETNRLIVAIDGLSRSGKTTITKELEKELQRESISYAILHIDDFITERSKRYHTGRDQWEEYYHLQWDVEQLKEHLFKPLQEEAILSLPFYLDKEDRHEWRSVHLPPKGVIIIEGVFLQRSVWRSFLDYIVYIDCSRETRFRRESNETQTLVQKFENRYWKAEEHYLKEEQPLENAGLVIYN
ncbi:kinase [Priestia koreensis]|uniref:kinase n=1 Tax=Priestia koreensis TaxID=284581 RepID=UPI003D030EE4